MARASLVAGDIVRVLPDDYRVPGSYTLPTETLHMVVTGVDNVPYAHLPSADLSMQRWVRVFGVRRTPAPDGYTDAGEIVVEIKFEAATRVC